MTSTVSQRTRASMGNREVIIVDLNVSAYPTNGESFTTAIAGLASGQDPMVLGVIGLTTAVFARHDEANDKLILHDKDGEVANGVNVGVVRVLCCARVG